MKQFKNTSDYMDWTLRQFDMHINRWIKKAGIKATGPPWKKITREQISNMSSEKEKAAAMVDYFIINRNEQENLGASEDISVNQRRTLPSRATMDRSLQKLLIETRQEIKEIIDKENDREKEHYIGGKISNR